MPDLNHDIEKYLKGELSAAEMHQLEKRALSDPFLADALEGTENISSNDFSNDLMDLDARILRTQKKNIFTPLRIAAGVFILLGASSLFYFISKSTQEDKNLAQQTESKPSSQAGPNQPDTQKDTAATKNLLTLNEPEKIKQDKTAKTPKQTNATKPVENLETASTRENQKSDVEDQITEAAEEEKTEVTEELKPAPLTELKEKQEEQKIAAAETQSQLQSESLSRKESRGKKITSVPSATDASGSSSYQFNNSNSVVKGQVTSATDGSPMPGVNVVLKGTTTGTITDEQGNYVIELPESKNQELVFSFIGSHTDEIAVDGQSVVNVKMSDDVSQLSEVVVVGYGAADGAIGEPTTPTLLLAEPTGGRRSFKKYLETSLNYPQQALENKIEGRVTIQFSVKTDGSLDDFKVIKGLGYGCENEVIRLVKYGPKWSPSLQGETALESSVRVRMRFKLPD
jgi:TonB family protein